MNPSLHKPRMLLTPSPSKTNAVAPKANSEGKHPPNSTPVFAPRQGPMQPAANAASPASANAPLSPAVAQTITDAVESRSSLLAKLDPEFRAKINDAIINHDPPSYRGCYGCFNLWAHNVGFTAFYHYARRVRIQAALAESARTLLPDDMDMADMLPELLASRLFEALMNEDTTPGVIQRLTDAFHRASHVHLARRKLDAQIDTFKNKKGKRETQELLESVRTLVRMRAADLSLATQMEKEALAAAQSPPHPHDR